MWCSSGGFFPSFSILFSFYHIFTAFVFITMIIMINYYIKYSVNFWVTTMNALTCFLMCPCCFSGWFTSFLFTSRCLDWRARHWCVSGVLSTWFGFVKLFFLIMDIILLSCTLLLTWSDHSFFWIKHQIVPLATTWYFLLGFCWFFSLPNVQWYQIQMQHSGF